MQAARVHHAPRRRGGRVAARGARAAGGRSCRPSGSWARPRLRPGANGPPLLCSGCANSAGSRAAPSRSSIAGRRDAASAIAEIAAEFVRLKVDVIVTAGSRSPRGKAGDIGHPDRLRGGERTRSAAAWSRVWRDRAATSPACRSRRPILPASGSNSCARLSPVSAGWRSWPMSAIPPPCWRWARFRQRPARSASRSPHSKSGEPRISRPPSRRSRAARRRFMSVPTRS